MDRDVLKAVIVLGAIFSVIIGMFAYVMIEQVIELGKCEQLDECDIYKCNAEYWEGGDQGTYNLQMYQICLMENKNGI